MQTPRPSMRRRILLVLPLLLSACGHSGPDLLRLPAEVPDALLIGNVAVLDVRSGEVIPAQDVLIVGDRIARVTPTGGVDAPTGTRRIEGEGATLLPGLIDMHAHVGTSPAPPWAGELGDDERNLRSFLYSGVTTVLDPGDLHTQAFSRRDRVAAGDLLGPRIYASGPMITSPGGHPVALLESVAPWWIRWYIVPRMTRQVGTPEEARAAVRDVAGRGADVIKLSVDRIPEETSRLRRDVLAAAVEEANDQGVRTVAHIGSVEDAIDAAEAGTTLWVHGVYKERIPDDEIERLAGYGIPMVPTMVVFESYALLGQEPRVHTRLERETALPGILEAFEDPPEEVAGEDIFGAWLEMLYEQRQSARDNVRRLHEAGVTILAGSDSQSGVFPGPGLHRELHLLAEAGLTPAEAIRAATWDAAVYLADGAEPDFGEVTEGRRADLLLVAGDPTTDLGALADIREVLLGGVPLVRTPVSSPP